MVGDRGGRILDRIACLFVGACLLEDMGGQHIADAVRAVRQQADDRAPPRVRIVDAVALDRQPPGFIEGLLTVGCVPALRLDRLDEEDAWVGRAGEETRPVPVEAVVDSPIEAPGSCSYPKRHL